MADSMRGSRLGAVSYENEGGVEFAPRQLVPFDCPHGHAFAVPFSVEADLPDTWECRVCGATAPASRRDHRRGEGRPQAAHPVGHAAWSAGPSTTSRSCSTSASRSCATSADRPRADHPDHRKTA